MRRVCHDAMNPCQYIHGWSGFSAHVRAYALAPLHNYHLFDRETVTDGISFCESISPQTVGAYRIRPEVSEHEKYGRLCHGAMNPCQYFHGWSGVFAPVRAYALAPLHLLAQNMNNTMVERRVSSLPCRAYAM